MESHAWMTSHSKRKVYLHTTLLYTTSMYYIQYAMLLCKLTPSQVARKMSSEIFDFVTWDHTLLPQACRNQEGPGELEGVWGYVTWPSQFLAVQLLWSSSAAPYPVRPSRPRPYLDFENRRRQRQRAAIIGALPGLGARAAPVAPLNPNKHGASITV